MAWQIAMLCNTLQGVEFALGDGALVVEVDLYTDGACKGNPGPGGWGALLVCKGVEPELFGGEAATTNNRMELMAVIQGLSALSRPCARLPSGAAAREAFYSKVAGKSAAQVKATWARLTFSGKATPPREFSTSADARRHVAGNPDAIAYIEAFAVDASVKVVLTVS